MRSRDSRDDRQRFMMRLVPQTWETLEGRSIHVDTSMGEIIRQPVAHATPEDVAET